MKKGIFLIVVLLFIKMLNANPDNLRQVGSIEGSVIDYNTQQPLAGVNIIILNKQMGCASDQNGNIIIENIPIGSYQLEASMMGYLPVIKTEIPITTNRVTMVNFELKQDVLELDEAIQVTSGYFEKDDEKPISIKSLTPQEIKSSTGSAEDIFRILQSMPGVNHGGARDANLIVRGGSPDENRTLLDNIEIYNPLHFARPGASMGVISIINPSLLKKVDFMTGGFPAKYGDKMSSVFEMQLKEGNKSKFNTDINANFAGFGVLHDGPILGDGAIVLSARRGFFDLLTSAMDKPLSPKCWDFVGKATFNPGTNHKVSILGFYYFDDFLKDGDMPGHGTEIMRKYGSINRDDFGSALGINWRYLYSDRGYTLTTVSFTNNGWKSKFGDLDGLLRYSEKISENEFQLKSEITYKLFDDVEFKGGINWKTIDSDHEIWKEEDTTRTGLIIPETSVSYKPELTYKTGAFIHTTFRPFARLSINTGLRYDYFKLTNESKLSPRCGLSYQFSSKTTFNAAYGSYYQTPSVYQVALEDAENRELSSARATHYIAGIEQLLSDDTKMSIEVYQKDYNDVFAYNDISNVITNNGAGVSYGIEFFLQKKMSDNLIGSVAYTYSVSKRKDAENLSEYFFEYDRPHNFTMVTGYKFTDKLQVGLKFQYATGIPYTPIDQTTEIDGNWYLLEGKFHSARYPDYHKLDIRIDYNFYFTNWTLKTYIDIWNVYNKENVVKYIYHVDNNGVISKEIDGDFPLFPILGISAQF